MLYYIVLLKFVSVLRNHKIKWLDSYIHNCISKERVTLHQYDML